MKIFYSGGFLDLDVKIVQARAVSTGFQSGTDYLVSISDGVKEYTINCKNRDQSLSIANQVSNAVKNSLDIVELV